MVNFIKTKYNGICRRLKLYSLGIFYLKSSYIKIPKFLIINRHFKEIKFLNRHEHNFLYEFHEICINDCYHLRSFKKLIKNIETVVDIGANQSLFMIAARRRFPKASIFGYEPNREIEPVLTPNSKKLNAKVFYEAVTKEDCKVELVFGETDLNTRTKQSTSGKVAGTSFKKIIERAGGKIDLLKIDCEGGEWELFEDERSWQNVNALTMEYHLWAKEGSSFNEIESILEKLNFKIMFHKPFTDSFGIVGAFKNDKILFNN